MNMLTEEEIRALHEALDDEYQAWSTYSQVLTDFGEARTFSNIREAEARHIEALTTLFVRHGLPLPENTWPGRVPRYASLQQACEAAVAAEVANGQLYERLLGCTQRPDLITVLRRLQEASQQRHLPAFQRCADGGGGRGSGSRQRRGSPS